MRETTATVNTEMTVSSPTKMTAKEFALFFLSLIPLHPRTNDIYESCCANPDVGMTDRELEKFSL